MGRAKRDKFGDCYLSDTTIESIITDLENNSLFCRTKYELTDFYLCFKRCHAAQHHRFIDTIAKLEKFIKSEESISYLSDVDDDNLIFQKDYCIPFRLFAEITGRNRKTVYDWRDKGFLCVEYSSFRKCIYLKNTIEKLKKMTR